jgi:cytochrome c556
MMNKLLLIPILFTVLAITLLSPLTAQAQFAKAEDAIKYRQSTFSVMSTHFSRIGAVVKGEKPFDKEEVAANAAVVATYHGRLLVQVQKAVNHFLRFGKKVINSKQVPIRCKKQ